MQINPLQTEIVGYNNSAVRFLDSSLPANHPDSGNHDMYVSYYLTVKRINDCYTVSIPDRPLSLFVVAEVDKSEPARTSVLVAHHRGALDHPERLELLAQPPVVHFVHKVLYVHVHT